jgi:predicted nuclease with RNAse H fold
MSAGSGLLAVGIDVGGSRKGFHAVALCDRGASAIVSSESASYVAAWCRAQGASAIAIDAPSHWSVSGRARPCERQLAALGLSVFPTPSRAIGEVHPFYRWMVNGAALYACLVEHYRLYEGRLSPVDHPLCFETFPQAIACALAGKTLSAKNKRVDRRRLLEDAGLATESLPTIDHVDAALCAVAAQHVLAGSFMALGEAGEGFILVPTRSSSIDVHTTCLRLLARTFPAH